MNEKMKVGIFCSWFWKYGIGGTEMTSIALAEILSHEHSVEIVHNNPALSIDDVIKLSGRKLENIDLRYVECRRTLPKYRNRWKLYKEDHALNKRISGRYDLFINFVHDIPPVCHAHTGVLYVNFPFSDLSKSWRTNKRQAYPHLFYDLLRSMFYHWLLKRRLNSYQIKLSISEFSRKWTYERWKISSRILYVPVDISFNAAASKENTIISVGRFDSMKKQAEILGIFREMTSSYHHGWKMYCAGGLFEKDVYNEIMRRFGAEDNIRIIVNSPQYELKSLLKSSKIFWHAAGYGEDEKTHPERSEHFGRTTVEAMAAGCVPIVINKGGQPEIVQHGLNGFLWNTEDELKRYTMMLIQDERLRMKMAEAARVRAQFFSTEMFKNRFRRIIRHYGDNRQA
ncbi:MAG: glycosyltransferase family 4 protein [Candidatus Omnitrophica bacterium]|nr:glycosyltransferase family 4 protein [Candidatus Omnitrophota bacterium]